MSFGCTIEKIKRCFKNMFIFFYFHFLSFLSPKNTRRRQNMKERESRDQNLYIIHHLREAKSYTLHKIFYLYPDRKRNQQGTYTSNYQWPSHLRNLVWAPLEGLIYLQKTNCHLTKAFQMEKHRHITQKQRNKNGGIEKQREWEKGRIKALIDRSIMCTVARTA